MLNKLINREINAELIATFIFMFISFMYITTEYGYLKVIDILFLWMFPASVTIFLTLLIVKIIEQMNNRRVSKYKYVNLGE